MKRLYRMVSLAEALLDKPGSSFKHFCFITRKTKILSIGWNDTWKNNTKINGRFFRYPLGGVHAEASAISKLQDLNICRKATLVNIRLNRQANLRNSKPCDMCMGLLIGMGFSRVYYTTEEGFERIKL